MDEDKTFLKPGDTNAPKMHLLDSSDIVGCIFLMPHQEDGQKFRVRIIQIIDEHEKKLAQDPGHTQFICSVNDDQHKEIISYNDIINKIANQ